METQVNEARQKITEEALKINSTLATFIEEAVNKLVVNDKAATAVLDKEKSLSGCIKKITGEAKKRAANNVACLSEEEVREIALEYYGISEETPADNVIDIMDLL